MKTVISEAGIEVYDDGEKIAVMEAGSQELVVTVPVNHFHQTAASKIVQRKNYTLTADDAGKNIYFTNDVVNLTIPPDLRGQVQFGLFYTGKLNIINGTDGVTKKMNVTYLVKDREGNWIRSGE